jgi:anthranilate synthase component 2
MQAIGEVFGGELYNLTRPLHGRATEMKVTDKSETLFSGLPEQFKIGRYHSWAVSETGFPVELTVTAKDVDGVIMALKHKKLDVKGVQFHPESVLTEYGKEIIKNWLTLNP